MKIQEIIDKTFERMKSFNPLIFWTPLRVASNPPYDGAIWDDVMNVNGCANYIWSACLMDVLKPAQVIELGGAMGTWSICVLQTLPSDSQLYSITLPEDGEEFKFVVDKYPNFHPVIGDDLDLSNWPKDLDLSKTDVWYFDSLHTKEQLTKELELYKPFFKKGAILLFDDIREFGLWPVWGDVVNGKYGKMESKELTDPCHHSGWGATMVL